MPVIIDTDALRRMASRMEARSAGTFLELGNQMDAAELREIADALDEAARPRSRREIEGMRPRGLFARLFGRRA